MSISDGEIRYTVFTQSDYGNSALIMACRRATQAGSIPPATAPPGDRRACRLLPPATTRPPCSNQPRSRMECRRVRKVRSVLSRHRISAEPTYGRFAPQFRSFSSPVHLPETGHPFIKAFKILRTTNFGWLAAVQSRRQALIGDRPSWVSWHRQKAVGPVNRLPPTTIEKLEGASAERDANYPSITYHPRIQRTLESRSAFLEWEEVRPEVSDAEVKFITILKTEGDGKR